MIYIAPPVVVKELLPWFGQFQASILGLWLSRPPDFGMGILGVAGGGWRVSKYNYSLFCTESMLESGLFSRKREKFAQNVGVMVKIVIFGWNDNFLSCWLKKGHRNFYFWKIEILCWKSNYFEWNRKFLWSDPRPPRFQTRLTSGVARQFCAWGRTMKLAPLSALFFHIA